ncbi:phospholipase A1 [Parabacteroides sp. PF5-5]|uniref:phospholipase A n=1 Tax=unclassified Parabacteroides TaxID=2649774 RepID=UPI002476E9BA|nr:MULTISPECIES: phospholipase A [unclassified Parabacteroides]MDH6304252.1 phospholipase A1 [Parabacteroides sp. PH5-39]MDH6315033.1 phospholipase A1 [Parabacteroides sp. PF5-13]MDH6318693.1 phospholipase A1 [Parabacteroides sp. PH5-13]MDH6322423.1 phospholipase A1 [Parabacteroides sp. PH5-8]MDH6326442.1 phospholipase A1 [Parabacteroides sp. PH5-41]
MKTLFNIAVLLFISNALYSQILDIPIPAYNGDSVRAELEDAPYFTMFKDNYFIGGTTLGHKPTATNSDVKFQVSVMQRITKSVLPFDTYLFLQYSQKTFWNVFENSLPIRELNFNPGLGLGHLIIYKNRYIGKGYLMLEHESNGKDSLDSRSWNKVSLAVSLLLNDNFDVQFKGWIPIIDSRRNKDILRYNGLFQFGGNFRTNNRRFQIGLLLTKRKTWRMNFNTQLEFSYKINRNENQFLFLQFYNGYGENLLEYKVHQSKIRLGFVIKPRDFSIY